MAGAALLSACGGVLGPAAGSTVEALAPVACTIAAATADDQSYTSIATSAGGKFTGSRTDDLTVAANRDRIFGQRLRELQRAKETVAGLTSANDTEKALLEAAELDIEAAIDLVSYDRAWAPGDPKAPEPPLEFPTLLDEAIGESSQDIREAFATCSLPVDVVRRQQAYGGG